MSKAWTRSIFKKPILSRIICKFNSQPKPGKSEIMHSLQKQKNSFKKICDLFTIKQTEESKNCPNIFENLLWNFLENVEERTCYAVAFKHSSRTLLKKDSFAYCFLKILKVHQINFHWIQVNTAASGINFERWFSCEMT